MPPAPRPIRISRGNTIPDTGIPVQRAILPSTLRAHGSMTLLGRHPIRMARPGTPEVVSNPPSSGHHLETTYTVNSKDVIMKRYRVRSGLGYGAYSTVVLAEDKITNTTVAIKVLHKDEDMNPDLGLEERLYRKIQEGCSRLADLFAGVITSGAHRGFHCIVFQACHSTLYDVVKGYYGLMPLPGKHLLEIAYQIVKAIEYLHSLSIIHGDLKPDNIALKLSDTTTIRWLDPMTGFHDKKILVSTQLCILDLGSAIEVSSRFTVQSGRVYTQAYRAPEVTLGLSWSFGVDIFAVGCIIAELYVGYCLFPSEVSCDQEHLAIIDKVVGPFPENYARDIEYRFPGTFTFDVAPIAIQFPPIGFEEPHDDHSDAMRRVERRKCLSGFIHDIALNDLLRGLMAVNPRDRHTLEYAAKHKYFDGLNRLQWQ